MTGSDAAKLGAVALFRSTISQKIKCWRPVICATVRNREKPKLKIAVIESVTYDSKKLNELAALQSKPELISSIIGSLHAPISGIVHTISAVMGNLASIIEEVAKKQHAN